ncbi:MAG: DUF4760 domain-containing protein [Acidobacteriaceae bacterium]
MATTLATGADAGLILNLYELRREETMRKARRFVIFDFQPQSFDELIGLQRDYSTEQNAYWRQVISYWEMAHSFVLRGAIDADLFLDSQGEGIYIYAKFHAFHEEYNRVTGNVFMRHTADLVDRYPMARERFEAFVKSLSARHLQVARV